MTYNSQVNYTSTSLDHLGLVAGMCQELKIAETIDQLIPSKSVNKKVSHGKLVEAMILNGLGFTSKALYLTPEFFRDRPISRLLGVEGIDYTEINDDALGRTLDAVFEFNPTELYSALAVKASKILGLKSKSVHLDSTSFHTHGSYNSEDAIEGDTKVITITKGYSRDHRPELNQCILNLIAENKAGIPIFMQAASGNVNDSTNFKKIINNHIKALTNNTEIEYIIADSALYNKETISGLANEHLFITRVPITIKEAQTAIIESTNKELIKIDENYSYYKTFSNYGDCSQRWLIIKSKAADKREAKTVDRKILKLSADETKAFSKLCRLEFACKADAKDALDRFIQELKVSSILEAEIVANNHHATKGKPKKDVAPTKTTYVIKGTLQLDVDKAQIYKDTTGFFILTTNDLDEIRLPDVNILAEYKGQQKVERGFRFLKSPSFMVDSFFVKKPERVMSLLMIMTTCLMVYAALEYKIRLGLLSMALFFPNQAGKAMQNPTAKWVFECFSGIHVLFINSTQELILNLKERQKTILTVLGEYYLKIYS